MPNNYWIFLGSLFGGSAIVFGAFGAHYLKQYLDASSLLVFETGVRYQIYHALALVLIGVISFFIDKAQLTLAAYCFIFGTIFFFRESLFTFFNGYEVNWYIDSFWWFTFNNGMAVFSNSYFVITNFFLKNII